MLKAYGGFMKKIYKICGLVAMSFAVILSCIGIVFSNTPTTFAYDVSFTDASLLSTYVLGSELTAPEAKVSVGNIELDCTKQVLISPNGTAMTSNKYIF